MMVAGTSVPVVPCRLVGCFEALRPASVVPVPTKITIRIGTPLSFADTPQNREGWESVAARIKESVVAL